MTPLPAPNPAPTPIPAVTATVEGISVNSATLRTAIRTLQMNTIENTVVIDGTEFATGPSTLTSGLQDVFALVPGAGDTKLVARSTKAPDMPATGSSIYSGTAKVLIADGSSTYMVTMDALTTVTFGTSGHVGFSGTSVAQGGTVVDVSGSRNYAPNGSETVAFSNLALSGQSFSATSASRAAASGFGAGPELFDPDATLYANGVFAGQTPEELTGVASARASSGAEALVTFTGSR
ncbi:hypothetical protein [Pseudogemmobacter sp. W21_MBD1_M6]|uniref:hypothetical protein n=1 Tax=Pseudogemmobacter sp. W21_MBD1_M6 TaxID=3240271 RepID=UPI003F990910